MPEENDYIFNGTPMLTTKDNPYDPSTQFASWFVYDVEHGYNSCGILARLSHTSPRLSDEENVAELEDVIDRIIELDFTGNRMKVYAHM